MKIENYKSHVHKNNSLCFITFGRFCAKNIHYMGSNFKYCTIKNTNDVRATHSCKNYPVGMASKVSEAQIEFSRVHTRNCSNSLLRREEEEEHI